MGGKKTPQNDNEENSYSIPELGGGWDFIHKRMMSKNLKFSYPSVVSAAVRAGAVWIRPRR